MGKIRRERPAVQVFEAPRTQRQGTDPRRAARVDTYGPPAAPEPAPAGEPLPDVPAGELVDEAQEHPGTGQPMEPVEAAADGTWYELPADDPPAPAKRAPRKRAQKRTSGPQES